MARTSKPNSLRRGNAPVSVQLPILTPQTGIDALIEDDTLITPKPQIGITPAAMTPALTINSAAPAHNAVANADRPSTAEGRKSLENRTSQLGQPRDSAEKSSDYFATSDQPRSAADGQTKIPATPGDTLQESSTHSPIDGDKEEKAKEGGLFSKGFRMKFPKKLGRGSTDVKPVVVDEKSEESDRSEDREDKTIQDNFFGSIQKIRYDYEERLHHETSHHVLSSINPSSLSETPFLKIPPHTTVIIQDERLDSGGVADLYRGTVGLVGQDVDLIERVGPMWLGDLLLKVRSCSGLTHLFKS